MTIHLTSAHEKVDEQIQAHHDRQNFDALAKRDHVIGMWAAGFFGYKGDDALRYATEVIFADLEEPGDEDIIHKLMADFDYHGIPMNRREIEKQLLLAEETAKQNR